MNKVIGDPRPFCSDLYSTLKIGKYFDYSKYEKNYISQMGKIQPIFPYIKRLYLPYSKPSFIALRGLLVPLSYLEIMGIFNEREALSIGLDVFIVLTNDIFIYSIYDASDVIRWENVPIQYVHKRGDRKNYSVICTHLYSDPKRTNLLSVLYGAWHLFIEYKKFDRTGTFDLECASH